MRASTSAATRSLAWTGQSPEEAPKCRPREGGDPVQKNQTAQFGARVATCATYSHPDPELRFGNQTGPPPSRERQVGSSLTGVCFSAVLQDFRAHAVAQLHGGIPVAPLGRDRRAD